MKKQFWFYITFIFIGIYILISQKFIPQKEISNYSGKESFRVRNIDISSLYFEKNLGQTDEKVKFISKGKGYNLYFLENESVIHLKSFQSDSTFFHPIKMKLIGTDPSAKMEGENIMKRRTNYFIGNDKSKWRRNIPNYEKVKYKQIYPGIDLVYYGNEKKLEFDFVVNPGANPKNIKLQFNGSEKIELDKNGNLAIKVGLDTMLFQSPVLYQEIENEKKSIQGEFAIFEDNEVGFNIGYYNHDYPLIIDPVLLYSTYFGGTDKDHADGIAVDNSGDVYIVGETSSTDFPITNDLTSGDRDVIFVTKINAAGDSWSYSTLIGSVGGGERASDIKVDKDGNAYIIGQTSAYDNSSTPNVDESFPTVNGIPHPKDYGDYDAIICKLDTTGNLVYSTYLGGPEEEKAYCIAVDNSGCAYVVGYSLAAIGEPKFPIVNPFPANTGYNYDGFVTKLDPAKAGMNAVIYSFTMGGGGYDVCYSIAVDHHGYAYITGRTGSINFKLVNPIQSSRKGDSDAFILKLKPEGNEAVYCTYLGGDEGDTGRDIEVDNEGNTYILCNASEGFPTTPNAFQTNSQYGSGGTVFFKINSNGDALDYSTYTWPVSAEFLEINKNNAGYLIGTMWAQAADGKWFGRRRLEKFNQEATDTILTGTLFDLENTEYYIRDFYLTPDSLIYLTGNVTTNNFPTVYPLQDILKGSQDAFISKFRESAKIREYEIGEAVEYPGQFSTVTNENEVKFTRVFGKESLEIEAKIYEVKEDTLRFLLPCGLIYSQKIFLDSIKNEVTRDTVVFEITTNKGQPNETTITDSLIWILPKLLIYDQVVNPPVAIQQQILPQYDLIADYPIDVSSFFFLGASEDEMVGLRVVNTIQRTTYSPPLTLNLRVSVPGHGEVPPLQRFDEGPGDKAIQFDVKFDSIYCVCVFQEKNVAVKFPGFPAPFQIHLAGNVGNVRKLINSEPEFPRGTRQDILFNHPAPRPQQLLEYSTKKSKGAETALFKFTNCTSINPNVVAVLVPPRQNPEGMPLGGAYIRSPDPQDPVSITTPTAMTEALLPTFVGSTDSMVIDFTQLPYPVPPENLNINTFWDNTVAAVIGKNTKSVTLPLSNQNEIKSIICDMGSGNEIFNGTGNDFQIFASGSYQVAVSNTPFAETFVPISGTFSAIQQFDLAQTSLSSARYVRITGSPNVTLEAVAALNMFMDGYEQNVGPVLKTDLATMMMQRVKAFQTDINPYLQLIRQDGILSDHNPGGFGDDTNQILTDAALISSDLSVFGYQRFLAKGYDQRPGKEAFGEFHVRLETAGEWDPVDINVSNFDEKDTNPQKSGNFGKTRERDSYFFKAEPGQRIGMSGKALDSRLNPILELYDPEGFLIAANDDYKDRGRNPALSLNLPTKSFYSDSTLPNPSTYRIVVSAIDTAAGSIIHNGITAYQRKSTGGGYQLKVFKGALEGEELPGPTVTNCSPNGAIQGANNVEVLINGNDFVDGASVSFSSGSISVQSVHFISSNQLKIKINIPQSATIGWYDATVTNPDGIKKTIQHFFEVRSSFGTVKLSWEAPAPGETLIPPSNLTSYISEASTKKITINQKRNITLSKTTQLSRLKKPLLQSILDDVIEEIETNNDFNQAQVVHGDSSIWIDGMAETRDNGNVELNYGAGTDDVEDWFKFTSQDEYLEIILYGFSVDCDLFLFGQPDISGLVDYSNTNGDTVAEYLYIDPLPPGTYYVGVSIFDNPGADDTTYYALDIYGNFGSSWTSQLQSYNVYRSTSANARNTGLLVATVDSNITIFQDNPPSKQMFYYQVTAMYDLGESEPSNEASALITRFLENDEAKIPDDFQLMQNYPNPFNPSTIIEYSIPKQFDQSVVNLTVYDLSGRKIITLIHEKKTTGFHQVKWNGVNDIGQKLSSGMYIYCLQIGSFSEIRKMILLK